MQHRDGCYSVATGIADPFGRGYGIALFRGMLGKAKNPVIRNPMRRTGIDKPCVRVVHQCDRFAGRRIRKTENGKVGIIQRLSAPGSILALGIRQMQQLDITAILQACMNLQPCRPHFTVDENRRYHFGYPP